MRKKEKALLLAMCIGDGHLSKDKKSKSVSLMLSHCEKQRSYLEYKAKLVNSICGGRQNEVHFKNNNGYPCYTYRKADNYFRVLHKFQYSDGKKQYPKHILNRLTKEAFALWWMDDGGVYPKKRNGKIHAWCGFLNTYTNYEDSITIADVIEEMFGVRPLLRKDKGSYRLEFNTTKLRVMLPQISDFQVPVMAYKFSLSTSAQPHTHSMRDDIV